MKRSHAPYFFLIPVLVYIAIFWVFTYGFVIYMSFTNWSPLLPISEAQFVGLDNYVRALTRDETFLLAIQNAFIYVLYEPICIMIGLLLALVLNTAIRGQSTFRTIYFIPVITSVTAISFVWSWLYDYDFGLFNHILSSLGFPRQPFLVSTTYPVPLASIMLMSIWQYTGLNVIIFLAGLQSIPKEYHEAARVYGANAWNRFRHVTLPLLKPTFLFVAVTATVGSLQVFSEPWMFTHGVDPANSTMVPVIHMYNSAFRFKPPLGGFGYGATLAIIFFLIILVLSLIEIKLLRRGGMVYY